MRASRKNPTVGKRFAFVVDGGCESWYIQMLKRNEKSINIALEPQIPQKKKMSDQYSKVMVLSRDYDKVFWIVDFDVINDETQKSKKGNKTALQEFKEYYQKIERIDKVDRNIFVIINNPGLEFWFLLHFENTSKYFNTCDEAIKQLKKSLPDYEKTQRYFTKDDNDIYLKLKPFLRKAIDNTKKTQNFDFENTFVGLSQMNNFFEQVEIKHILKDL